MTKPARIVFSNAITALFVLASLVVVRPATALAPTTYETSFGLDLPDPVGARSMRFFPSSITVHRGDIVHVTSGEADGVVFLPAGQDPDGWIGVNADTLDAPWFPFASDPDEGSKALKVNPRVAFPTDDCGAPAQTPCHFDGSGDGIDGVLGSGLILDGGVDLAVRITAPAGTTLWALSVLYPNLRMQIDVVTDGAAASTQQSIDQTRTQDLAADEAAATSLDTQLKKFHKKTIKNGKTTWFAYAGADAATVSLLAFYPQKLTIHAGDSVQWLFSKLSQRTRTVTFPASKATSLGATGFEIVCDPDGDTGTTPDNDPDLSEPPYCMAGAAEVDLAKTVALKAGDGKILNAKDFDSSGPRGGGWAPSKAPYVLRFPKTSPGAGFSYGSILSPSVPGTVVVKPA